jgi:hypothetical protein
MSGTAISGEKWRRNRMQPTQPHSPRPQALTDPPNHATNAPHPPPKPKQLPPLDLRRSANPNESDETDPVAATGGGLDPRAGAATAAGHGGPAQ